MHSDLGIVNAYTFRCSALGSAYTGGLAGAASGRTKRLFAKLYTRNQIENIRRRYSSGAAYDLHNSFTAATLLESGADLARGINFAAKRLPLLRLWFRQAPRALVKLPRRRKGARRAEEAEQALVDREHFWKAPGLMRAPKLQRRDLLDKNTKRKRKRKATELPSREEPKRDEMSPVDSEAQKISEDVKRRFGSDRAPSQGVAPSIRSATKNTPRKAPADDFLFRMMLAGSARKTPTNHPQSTSGLKSLGVRVGSAAAKLVRDSTSQDIRNVLDAELLQKSHDSEDAESEQEPQGSPPTTDMQRDPHLGELRGTHLREAVSQSAYLDVGQQFGSLGMPITIEVQTRAEGLKPGVATTLGGSQERTSSK